MYRKGRALTLYTRTHKIWCVFLEWRLSSCEVSGREHGAGHHCVAVRRDETVNTKEKGENDKSGVPWVSAQKPTVSSRKKLNILVKKKRSKLLYCKNPRLPLYRKDCRSHYCLLIPLVHFAEVVGARVFTKNLNLIKLLFCLKADEAKMRERTPSIISW